MMKRITQVVWGLVVCWPAAVAQTHKVARPESVVRAVGVYEWTGDLAKPTASRLIPVSLAINGSLEDAGVYLARPIPFALLPGNDYLLQTAGIDRGSVALLYARHLTSGDSTYEDGWFGYGSYKPLAPPKKQPALRAARTPGVITGSGDSGRPHLTTKSASGGDQGTTSATTKSSGGSSDADPDRPHLTRKDEDSAKDQTKTDGGTGQSTDSGGTSQSDPDRPTMRRRSADTSTDGANSTTETAGIPSDDPDRPTLKRHIADDGKKKQNGNDIASVSGTGSLNDDPDRPNLHRGKPAGVLKEADLPKLAGLPTNLHQMIAVSDAVNRPEHDFARAWDDENEKAGVLTGMQALARAQLAKSAGAKASPASAAKASVAASKTSSTVHRRATTTHAGTAVQPLLDEELRAYTLSYGGLATFVYTAHTAGEGASLRYVTVVAQRDAMGVLKPALQSATDATHLDRTPRMRLIDVVDADASNRASLLFELRAQSSRQFALYRVIGASADQILLTGSTE